MAADAATAEEYEELLSRCDLEKNPADHQRLAAWCKKNHPPKYEYHLGAYNRYVFDRAVAKLPAEPTDYHFKILYEMAGRLGLSDEEQEYLSKWGEIKYATFAERIKPGDVAMMKQLVEWCDKHGVTFIDPVRELAAEILTHDESYELARELLRQVEWEGLWMSKVEAIDSINITSIEERIALHQAAAAARARVARKYPADPFSGMVPKGEYHQFSPRRCPEAKFFLHESGYSSEVPSRLIIALHDGGESSNEESAASATEVIQTWIRQKGEQIVLAPVASEQATEVWRKRSNVYEVIDAIEEVCERFNIDRRRIYVSGDSMGASGVTTFYSAFPELAAASCARAGLFSSIKMQSDLAKKPMLIIQGEVDTPKRIRSKEAFLKMAAECNGDVTDITLGGVGHDIPEDVAFRKLLPFFAEHSNETEPDFDIIRAAAKKWMFK